MLFIFIDKRFDKRIFTFFSGMNLYMTHEKVSGFKTLGAYFTLMPTLIVNFCKNIRWKSVKESNFPYYYYWIIVCIYFHLLRYVFAYAYLGNLRFQIADYTIYNRMLKIHNTSINVLLRAHFTLNYQIFLHSFLAVSSRSEPTYVMDIFAYVFLIRIYRWNVRRKCIQMLSKGREKNEIKCQKVSISWMNVKKQNYVFHQYDFAYDFLEHRSFYIALNRFHNDKDAHYNSLRM